MNSVSEPWPEALERYQTLWGFVATEELPGGFCSRVFASEELVLKLPFQGEEMVSGWRAYAQLEKVGGPKVYQADSETGAVLMERLRPGTKLTSLGLEPEAEDVFVQLAWRCRSLCLLYTSDAADE